MTEQVLEYALQVQIVSRIEGVAFDVMDRLTAPHVVMRPTVVPDGDKWIALYGSNIQEGVCGCGDTPAEACADFDKNWRESRSSPAPSGGKDREMSSFDHLDGCIITLADPTGQIERECAEKVFTQKSVALTYALAMHAESHGVPVDWPRANAAIRSRWPKGLVRVKEMAWKLSRERAARPSESAALEKP